MPFHVDLRIRPAPLPAAVAGATPPCPPDMQHVQGQYCPEVAHTCARWLETHGRYARFRCAEYVAAECSSEERVPTDFCIDRTEYTDEGERLPRVHTTWYRARELCREQGKRLCTESEWEFACEGATMRPYPYGWVRDASACNIDRDPLHGTRTVIDQRAPVGSHPRCASPFGVLDMSGNVQEWVVNDREEQRHPSVLKGAWWQPGQNHCRAAMLDHGPGFEGVQIGFRCCKSTS